SSAINDISARDGWRDVPLWITRGPRMLRTTAVYKQTRAKVPMVVVELADNRWTRCFETALQIFEVVLHRVDRGRSPSQLMQSGTPRSLGPGWMNDSSTQVIQRLTRQADQSIES